MDVQMSFSFKMFCNISLLIIYDVIMSFLLSKTFFYPEVNVLLSLNSLFSHLYSF